MVLAKASAEDATVFGKKKKGKSNGESELRPLIFPLVQVALGAIK